MQKNNNTYKKVLVLGSGALKIGEAGEFDYSGSQAIKALKSEGIKTVLVNPNIATIQTSQDLADEVYFIPVQPDFIEKVIMRERPDGILLSVGGQTALNCGVALYDRKVFSRFNISVLGSPVDAIKKTEDRELFKQQLKEIGCLTPKSLAVHSVSEAIEASKEIPFPLMIRVAYALGGQGSTVVYNEKDLADKAEKALAGSNQILVEEYLHGWKEIEYEVVRDSADNCIIVCNMENMDPMGIHTGESIVIAPSQTLTNDEYFTLRKIAQQTIRHLGIVGECNIQFALNPKTFDYRIIEVNARLSRSSALASKATGYPLAYVSTKIALGKRLDEIENSVTGVTTAFFEPALDYVVVKIPRWDLTKFKNAHVTLGSEMKSVGEVMAIGKTFEEAVQKAVRMLDLKYEGILDDKFLKKTPKQILEQLQSPSSDRLMLIASAFVNGISVDTVHELTQIDPWFLNRLKSIASLYNQISASYEPEKLLAYKQLGFSDNQIAALVKSTPEQIRSDRKQNGVVPHIKLIDTLAGEFPSVTNYSYFTYHATQDDLVRKKHEVEMERKKILILGGGPYRIGSSVEFDWCAVNSVLSLKKRGFTTIMLNCNPETVSTDYDYADILYFDELTGERVLDIWDFENPQGIILSVGGQTPNNLASFCLSHDIPLLGTSAESILKAENRQDFSNLLEEMHIYQPPWDELKSADDVKQFASSVGYPVLARPSFVLSGEAMSVLYSDHEVDLYLNQHNARAAKSGVVVVSKFIEGAREIDFDGVAEKGHIILKAISEHIESAGVHSGDSTLVLPSFSIGNEIIAEIDSVAAKIAQALSISGPFNIQFLERKGFIMVIECNLRCSRSFPFVSKVTGVNFMDAAISAMLAEDKGRIDNPPLHHVGVKAAQFSFSRIKGADPVLRVEMSSTGEVATMGNTLYDALLKSLISTGFKLPRKSIFLSIGGWEQKEDFFPFARILHEMGFTLYATDKTEKFLSMRGIPVKHVEKLQEKGHPNSVDILRKKEIDMVINITEPPAFNESPDQFMNRATAGYQIRRSAIDYHVPLITNINLAMLFVRALQNKQFHDLEVLPASNYINAKNRLIDRKGDYMSEPINGIFAKKDIVSVDQFALKDIQQLFTLAAELKNDVQKEKYHEELKGKMMAAIFYEPSSRTFGSFVTAMQRLGGGIIPLQGVVYSSVAKGELLPDTIRTFANYADVIVLRYPEEGGAAIAAEYSPVPVINAGDGAGEHPTQALLDLFTISEHFGKPDGLTIGMVGDLLYGRTIHSLSKLLALYKNVNLYLISPDNLKVKRSFKETLQKKGVKLTELTNLEEAIGKLDVLYMTRVQKERFADLGEYEKVKNYYILTPELMHKAKKDMIIMHPFPRVGEISYDVDEDPRAVYIREEMRNGLFVRMALLLKVLGKA